MKNMSEDNPYAAPQTIESQAPTQFPYLVRPGVARPRRLSVDWDTARLKAVLKRSNVIKEMQAIWLIMCFAMPVIAAVSSLSFGIYEFGFDSTRSIIGLCFVGLTFTRFGTGFVRTSMGRVFALAMDGLLAIFCALVSVIFIAAIFSQPGVVLILIFFGPIILLIGYQAICSLRAVWQAPELFGPQRIPHEVLVEEAKYRELHQIS